MQWLPQWYGVDCNEPPVTPAPPWSLNLKNGTCANFPGMLPREWQGTRSSLNDALAVWLPRLRTSPLLIRSCANATRCCSATRRQSFSSTGPADLLLRSIDAPSGGRQANRMSASRILSIVKFTPSACPASSFRSRWRRGARAIAPRLAADAVDHAPALHRRAREQSRRPSAGRACSPARCRNSPAP